MSINFYNGDLLKSNCDYICHQVNCQGAMNSGIAKQIRQNYPIVYNQYKGFCEGLNDYIKYSINPETHLLLGRTQIVPIKINKDGPIQSIVNLFAQNRYGYDGCHYTSYDAFARCLCDLTYKVPKGSKIGFPYGIGCVRGGAKWPVILALITEYLAADYEVEIWKLEENK